MPSDDDRKPLRVIPVQEAELPPDILEAIALLVGHHGGLVSLPAAGVSAEVIAQLRTLCEPAGVEVHHAVQFVKGAKGASHVLDVLRFTPKDPPNAG